ncbi:thymidylate synthase [Bacillus phage 000TH008]|nr:thymidylate synthase [Bacillus phage 000TH008]QQO40909.1 thymidylate synthase [Bacillus phage 000TH009]
MTHADLEYLNLVKRVMKEGHKKEDRTGTGTISLFGPQMEFDLSKGFPLLTTKKLPFRIIAEELLWFIKGDTDLKTLLDKNIHIWTPDAYRFYRESGGTLSYEVFVEKAKEDGFDLGPIYGAQWGSWGDNNIDQLRDVIEEMKNNPESRRMLVSAWNPTDLPRMALPPCHTMFQFYVANRELSCKLYQRSGDVFLGVPFNIASYALLTHIIAKMTGLKVGKFIHTLGDAHLYSNHLDSVFDQLKRKPKELPKLEVKTVREDIRDYTIDDFELIGYDPHPVIKGKLSVGLKDGGEK